MSGTITAAPCDQSDPADVAKFVAEANAQMGGIDVMVNNVRSCIYDPAFAICSYILLVRVVLSVAVEFRAYIARELKQRTPNPNSNPTAPHVRVRACLSLKAGSNIADRYV